MNTTGVPKHPFWDFNLTPGKQQTRKLVALMRFLAGVRGKEVRVRVRIK